MSLNEKSMREGLIAPCGINCRLCRAYGRAKNGCFGCRQPGEYMAQTKAFARCRIRNCERRAENRQEFCYQCERFPCRNERHLDKRYSTKYGTSVVDNLERIKESGMDEFLRLEQKKWTCPECGEIICMHKEECTGCGYRWH